MSCFAHALVFAEHIRRALSHRSVIVSGGTRCVRRRGSIENAFPTEDATERTYRYTNDFTNGEHSLVQVALAVVSVVAPTPPLAELF